MIDPQEMLSRQNGPCAKLLSPVEAAEIWGITESAIRKAIATGKLQQGRDCVKIGKQWIISVDGMARAYNRYAGPADYGPWSLYLTNLQKAAKLPIPGKTVEEGQPC